METQRRPGGIESREFDTELKVQIRLGEMQSAEGLLGPSEKRALIRMKEIYLALADKVSGFETPEQIRNFVWPVPVAENLTGNTDVLLSM